MNRRKHKALTHREKGRDDELDQIKPPSVRVERKGKTHTAKNCKSE